MPFFDLITTFSKADGPVKIILNFHGENFFLSNMYPAEVFYKKRVYPANENGYYACRSRSDDIRVKLMDMKPIKAKEFSRSDEYKDTKWPDELPIHRVLRMAYFVGQKFFNHPHLGDKLLATEDAVLIEGNSWNDSLFGVDMSEGFGSGDNALGKLHMWNRRRLSERRGAG